MPVWIGLKVAESHVAYSSFFFFFFSLHMNSVGDKKHCSRTVYALFTDPTILFTHLKIILLQCFQFSVFSFSNNKFNLNRLIIKICVLHAMVASSERSLLIIIIIIYFFSLCNVMLFQ